MAQKRMRVGQTDTSDENCTVGHILQDIRIYGVIKYMAF